MRCAGFGAIPLSLLQCYFTMQCCVWGRADAACTDRAVASEELNVNVSHASGLSVPQGVTHNLRCDQGRKPTRQTCASLCKASPQMCQNCTDSPLFVPNSTRITSTQAPAPTLPLR